MRVCAPSPWRLFALPEHQVHEAADERHGEADPGQDVGGAEGAHLQILLVEALVLSRVDGRRDHHAHSCEEEEDGNYAG